MMKLKVAFGLLAVMSVLFCAGSALSQVAASLRHTAEFSQEEFSFHQVMGYDMVRSEHGSYLADLGKPMLPCREVRVALPSGMAVQNVRVMGTTEEEFPGQFSILPSQPPVEIGTFPGEADFIEPDKTTYQSSQPYPSRLVKFVRQTDLAGQSMATLRFYPLQYLPAEKKLKLHTSISIIIEGAGGYVCGDYLSANISEKGKNAYQEMITDMVENPQEVQLKTTSKSAPSMVPPGGPFDHVIITSSSYAADFQPLVDWHTQKGVKDTVITTSWIYSNYGGSSNQERIRSLVSDANSSWGTTYFLLAGEHETVPFEYRTFGSSTTPGDQYYSDFDDDWTMEVFVGRATVSSTTEINTFIDKVLKYEKNPPLTDYPTDALLIGMDYDAITHVEYLKGLIHSHLPSGFNVTRVYDSYDGNHRTDVINALNSGQNLVNHADHSYISYMGTGDRNHGWGIGSSDVDALVNDDQLSVIVSTGCHPNHMDYNDCIAEHFVIHNPNQGAVAFTGNARSGYYYSGDPYSLSNALEKQWWIALFDNHKYNVGQTIADAKHHFNEGGSAEQHCEWTFNLLGEPEMPLWTGQPDSLQITCADTFQAGSSPFVVHVENATYHHDVSLAYVCLWKGDEVYLTGYTDFDGEASFDPLPSTEGTMLVTATKGNYLPCEGGAYVFPPEYMVGDANGDLLVDLADVVYLLNYLFKGDLPPYPLGAGDANLSGQVDLADVIYLLNYLFKDGPAPGLA